MRKTLLSASVVTGVGAVLVAGGAFSVFNDTGSATGTYKTGVVKLSLGDNVFHLAGNCVSQFTDATHSDASQNMGSVNNTSCTSTVPVSNAGTLPVSIDGTSTVTDAISDALGNTVTGSTCFVSSFTAADLTGPLLPGASRNVHVTTVASPDNACQGFHDVVTAAVKVVESLPTAS
jgi:hypothetical protein